MNGISLDDLALNGIIESVDLKEILILHIVWRWSF